jgi:anti-sigma factor RsiW
MSPHPCRESELDALLAGELSAEQAEHVRAHVATCGPCTKSLAWLKAERRWMAQRARRQPSRPALRFSALEARLPPPAPRRARWAELGRMALGAAAAVTFVALGLMPRPGPPSLSEENWGEELVSMARVDACMDPSIEAVARMEASVGACLLASPAHVLR